MARARTDGAVGTHRRGVPGRPLRQRLGVWWRRRITWGRAVWRVLSARAGIAHLVRAGERFSDRMGNHFAAAITYFSFLSLVPIVMVAFAAAGFVLSSRPDLLDALKDQVTGLLGSSVGGFVGKAVDQRTQVAVIGLIIAAYSGLSWIGNVRDAVRAQWRPTWERAKRARENFLMSYVWDLVSLLGLLVAVLVTFALTAVGTAAQNLVIGWLGLDDVSWLGPVFTVGPFLLAIGADMLIFAWIYTILPYRGYRADRRTLLIGSLAMSVCFEVLKAALTILVTRMAASPTGAVFGSVIGLLLFFNLVARAFLMVAAWIATGAEQRAGGVDQEGEPAAGAGDPAGSDGAEPVTVVLREPAPRRSAGAAFGLGAALGWIYGRRRRR
jgi:membrane protein